MATIKEVKEQIQNANALGIKNLKEKGVGLFSSGIITTYDIMEAISMIIVGGDSGIEYTDITYNEDNTITLTDTDGVEHTMECEYTDGKLTSVKYDGKAVALTYDGDVLVKVGKTVVDLVYAPKEPKTTVKADSCVAQVFLPVVLDTVTVEINSGTIQADSSASLEE